MKFEEYHPSILCLYFVALFTCTLMFQQPVFIVISFVTVFLYSVYLKGKKALIFNIIQCLLWAVYPFIYASYNHFGITDIYVNFIGNSITMESFLHGLSIAVRGASLVMCFECLYEIFSSDKLGYILGRISAHLALYFSILLRTVPQIREKFKDVYIAQKGIGKNVWSFRTVISIVSIVSAWAIEQFVEKTKSMNSRGYILRGKTVFSIYRFNNRDRGLIIWIFLLLTIIMSGHILEQTRIVFSPQIIMNPITSVSFVFYLAYTLFCLFPMLLEMYNMYRFKYALKKSRLISENQIF